MQPLPTNLTIARITTTVFRLPMHGSLQWGRSSSIAEVRHVVVEVSLSNGASGVAEAPPRPTIYGETVHTITGVIEHELAPRLVGVAVSKAPTRLHELRFNFAAKGAVDMALHDAVAQSRGVDLATHLGSTAAATRVSYILGIGERDEVLAEAQRVVSQGVRVLKVKVGRDWDDDLALIEELQQLLGPTVDLYADANECLEPEDASRKLSILAEHGLRYCEEPLPVEYIRERAALRAEGRLPLIADDSAFTIRDLRRELELDTFDILNIKTARTGYTESNAMLALAQKVGKGIMVGSQASAGLGTVRAALFAALPGINFPSELSFFLKLKADILDRPLVLTDGTLDLATVRAAQVDRDLLRDAAVK